MKSNLSRFIHKPNSGRPATTATTATTRQLNLHGFTLEELQALAHPDEWEEVKDNPAAIEAFASSLKDHGIPDGG